MAARPLGKDRSRIGTVRRESSQGTTANDPTACWWRSTGRCVVVPCAALPDGVGSSAETTKSHTSPAQTDGAKIVEISEEDREVYEHFLLHGDNRGKRSLALGVDKT